MLELFLPAVARQSHFVTSRCSNKKFSSNVCPVPFRGRG